jgi:hypothetical protein
MGPYGVFQAYWYLCTWGFPFLWPNLCHIMCLASPLQAYKVSNCHFLPHFLHAECLLAHGTLTLAYLLDPHMPVSMPAGSPHALVCACWILARLCPCPLDPCMPMPAGSPHTLACWIPMHTQSVPTGSSCMHTLSPCVHTHRICMHGPHLACSQGPHACSLVGPPYMCMVSVLTHTATRQARARWSGVRRVKMG